MLMFGLVMVLMMMWRPQDCCPEASACGAAQMSETLLKVSD